MTEQTERKLTTCEMVMTHHEMALGHMDWSFKVRAGSLVLQNEKEEPTAELFSIGYFLEEPEENPKRPITFAFNGGPGASSIWVHLGAMGPWRVSFGETIKQPAPPYRFEENPASWLSFTDLVFVDAPGTGFSRALGDTELKSHWGVWEDAKVFGEFIRLYCSTFDRWLSPKYLAGESYGGMRSVALCKELQEVHGMELSGLLLISPVVDYQTMANCPGNHIAAACFLPSYAATAHHHRCLAPRLQDKPLETILKETEDFALNEYLPALAQGTAIDNDRRAACIDKLSTLTGLSKEYLQGSHMSVDCARFRKELLRQKGLTVGRFDSRLTGNDYDGNSERPDYDPADCLTVGPYVAPFHDLLSKKLGVKEKRTYNVQNSAAWKEWQWRKKGERNYGFVNLTPDLRSQMVTNERLRVLFVSGLYDIATPYFAARYTMNSLRLDGEARKRVKQLVFPGGHMMYTDEKNHKKLSANIRQFYEGKDCQWL